MSAKLPTIQVSSVEDFYIVMASVTMVKALKKIEEIAAKESSVECPIEEIVKIAKRALRAAGVDG